MKRKVLDLSLPTGGGDTGGRGHWPLPCWCMAHVACVAHVVSVAHRACVSGCFAGRSHRRGCERSWTLFPAPWQPLHQWRFWERVERATRVSGGGLAALASDLHFPSLQEEVFSFLVMLHLELWKQHSLIDVDNFKLFHLPLMALFTQTALLSYLIFPLVIWLLFIAEFCPMCQHFFGTQVLSLFRGQLSPSSMLHREAIFLLLCYMMLFTSLQVKIRPSYFINQNLVCYSPLSLC